jgi:alpha-beta hydrolase superfamily lysophospholipase
MPLFNSAGPHAPFQSEPVTMNAPWAAALVVDVPQPFTIFGASNAFKFVLVVILSGFIPVTIAAFLRFRRIKKTDEFSRVVQMLNITDTEADFARDRVAEQYAGNNYVLPVSFAWIFSLLGFFALLFGADLVAQHHGKANFLLTGLRTGDSEVLQAQRYQSMVVLTLAFCGAFLWSMQNMLRRLSAGDLTPTVYFNAGIRMTLAPMLALMVSHVVAPTPAGSMSGSLLPALAFLVGFFPNTALQYLKERVAPVFGGVAKSSSGANQVAHDLPLGMIEGIDVYDRARLDELGIQDAQNLASANLIELVVRTSFNPIQLIDWIAQAKLYVAFKDDIRALRKSQVRTMFDMLPAAESEDYLLDIAAATGLPAANLRHYCTMLNRDPSVKRLLGFQQQLCVPPANLDSPVVSTTPGQVAMRQPTSAFPLTLAVLIAFALAGCAAPPLGPLAAPTTQSCNAAPDSCFALARSAFEAYRQGKLHAIATRSNGYRMPSAPVAMLHPHRTRYAALLVHGLNDSAYYMEDLAAVLYDAGFNVITILLPGHGTNTADMRDVTAEQWREEVQTGLSLAAQVGDRLIVGGMSLGGALAIDAVQYRSDIAGLLLFVPALQFRSYSAMAWLTCAPVLRTIAVPTPIVPNPVKYKDRQVNGVCQLYRLMMHNVRNAGQASGDIAPDEAGIRAMASSIHVPTFVALTYADVRVSPRAILEFAENVKAPAVIATFGVPKGFEPPAPGNGAIPLSITSDSLQHSYLVRRSNAYNGQCNPYFGKMRQTLLNFLKTNFPPVDSDSQKSASDNALSDTLIPCPSPAASAD